MAESDTVLEAILTQLGATGTAMGELTAVIAGQSAQLSERHLLITGKLDQLQTEGQNRAERITALEARIKTLVKIEVQGQKDHREHVSWLKGLVTNSLELLKQPLLWLLAGGLTIGGVNMDSCVRTEQQRQPVPSDSVNP